MTRDGFLAAVYTLADTPHFTWFNAPPTGPGVPFGNPALVAYDSLRVLCFVAGAVGVVFAAGMSRRRGGVIGQRIRLICQVGLILYVLLTEMYRFGDYANLRLVLAVFVTVGSAWGNYLGWRYEAPPEPHLHRKENDG